MLLLFCIPEIIRPGSNLATPAPGADALSIEPTSHATSSFLDQLSRHTARLPLRHSARAGRGNALVQNPSSKDVLPRTVAILARGDQRGGHIVHGSLLILNGFLIAFTSFSHCVSTMLKLSRFHGPCVFLSLSYSIFVATLFMSSCFHLISSMCYCCVFVSHVQADRFPIMCI